MRINTNVSSLIAHENMTNTNIRTASSLEKLSTGYRINKASDDASGLAIADKLRTHANALDQAAANGNSAIALLQIADKAMAEQSNILDIIKQKLIQGATATTSQDGLIAIGKDIRKLLDQIYNIAAQTTYNGIQLLQADADHDGFSPAASQLTFQLGANAGDTIQGPSSVQSNALGLNLMYGGDCIESKSNEWASGVPAQPLQTDQDIIRNTLLGDIDTALTKLNGWRADFGSTQNQVESAVRNLMTQVTNTKAAESVIRDVDYAQESANFNKNQILMQAGTYAMSQANAKTQMVLKFLQ